MLLTDDSTLTTVTERYRYALSRIKRRGFFHRSRHTTDAGRMPTSPSPARNADTLTSAVPACMQSVAGTALRPRPIWLFFHLLPVQASHAFNSRHHEQTTFPNRSIELAQYSVMSALLGLSPHIWDQSIGMVNCYIVHMIDVIAYARSRP